MIKHKKITTKNGLRIVHIPMKDNPATTVLVLSESGSKYESKEQNGISHFLEHVCFKGTAKRPGAFKISEELDSIGAQYNAFTSHEFTGYYAKAPIRQFEKILDVVSDLYLNPSLPAKELEKEKGVILEEINMYEDLPQRVVMDMFMSLLYGDQPAGRNILGTKETVSSFSREDVVNYRSKHYVSEGTLVLVSGNLPSKEVFKKVESAFAGISETKKSGKKRVAQKQTKPAQVHRQRKVDQAHLVLGFRTFQANHKDSATLQIINGVLGGGMSSRLFQKLRDEMGVAYYVRSFEDLYTDHGYMAVRAGVTQNRLKEIVSVICEEFKKLKEEKVSPKELKKVKEYITGSMLLGLETSDSVAEFYAEQEILEGKMRDPKSITREIQSVTAEDVQRVARKIFCNKNLNLSFVNKDKNSPNLGSVLSVE